MVLDRGLSRPLDLEVAVVPRRGGVEAWISSGNVLQHEALGILVGIHDSFSLVPLEPLVVEFLQIEHDFLDGLVDLAAPFRLGESQLGGWWLLLHIGNLLLLKRHILLLVTDMALYLLEADQPPVLLELADLVYSHRRMNLFLLLGAL